MLKVAVYGKGGIGKSTVTSNLAAAFANMGKRVIQIGCDPKADSTINLLGGEPLRPVMNYMREEDEEPDELSQISKEGYGGILCIETGGPTPGLGCAGRGIIATFQLLEDMELFEHYKDLLGKNAPKNFAEFQEIKYSVEWESFKAYSRAINTGELTPLADFELYKAISKEIDEKIVGIVTSNNIKITGKSYHCIARTIGSIEQKRNGVQVSDILDALTSKEAEILPVKESNNGRSQKFRNKAVEVSVNPDTGNIIQVNPVHTGRKKAKS